MGWKRALLSITLTLAGCSQEASEASSSEAELGQTAISDAVAFDLSSVKDIELTLDPAAMAEMTAQAKAAAADRERLFDPRIETRGTFRLRLRAGQTAPCDVEKTYGVTVRIKGMISVQGFDKKPSLRVDFDEPFCGVKKLTLNNSVQDRSFVHQALAYRMYGAMGVAVPRFGYSSVSINAAPYGLSLTLETIDKRFLERAYGDHRGTLYEGTWGGDLRAEHVGTPRLDFKGDDSDPEARDNGELRALIAAVEAPGDGVFYGPSALIDTPNFLATIATSYVIGDWDNYISANNYRIFRPQGTRRWTFIPTGTDQSFERWLHPRAPARDDRPLPVLVAKCFASSRCTADYERAVERAAQKLHEPEGTLVVEAERLWSLIEGDLARDTRRPQTNEAVERASNKLRSFIAGRPADVRRKLATPPPTP